MWRVSERQRYFSLFSLIAILRFSASPPLVLLVCPVVTPDYDYTHTHIYIANVYRTRKSHSNQGLFNGDNTSTSTNTVVRSSILLCWLWWSCVLFPIYLFFKKKYRGCGFPFCSQSFLSFFCWHKHIRPTSKGSVGVSCF